MIQCRFIVYFVLFFVPLLLSGPSQGQGIGGKAGADDNAKAKQALQKEREEAQKVLKKESNVLSELERLDRQVEKEQEQAQKIEEQVIKSREKIDQLHSEIQDIALRIDRRRKLLNARITAIYKVSRMGTLAALFSAESFSDLLMRYKFLGVVAQFDSDLINGYEEDIRRMEMQKRSISQEILLQGNLRQENDKRLRSLQSVKGEKEKLLHTVRMEKATHMQAVAELEKAHNNLNRMMASLRPMEKEPPSAPPALDTPLEDKATGKDQRVPGIIAWYKGKLKAPVDGKVIETFGQKRHPRFNTVIFQKGIDIAAATGSEIRSIFKGNVLYSGWFPGYGQMIIIDHGKSYYSVYAHSSKLFKKVGDPVVEGEPIGLVGETGSLKGSCLYFEIRHHGVPQDPLEWIRM